MLALVLVAALVVEVVTKLIVWDIHKADTFSETVKFSICQLVCFFVCLLRLWVGSHEATPNDIMRWYSCVYSEATAEP